MLTIKRINKKILLGLLQQNMDKKDLELQQKGEKLVSLHILCNLCLTTEKELEENPELLYEAKNYYMRDEVGNKVEEEGENGYYPEIMEYWAVDEWLANKLENKEEIIFEMLDFRVWGRQTTGQAISLDYVIQKIAEETF